jgi:cytidine diphosphoramidate kinase
MTSAAEALPLHHGRILWITGLAGAGKTTLARAVVDALRSRESAAIAPLLLDGDALRDALDGGDELGDADEAHTGYDRASRLRRAWRIARLAQFAASQDIPVVVATISLFDQIHAFNRHGPVPYAEIVLDAPLACLRQRNPALYVDSVNVVGVGVAAEFPSSPELVIPQEFARWMLSDHVSKALAVWDAMPARFTAMPRDSSPPSTSSLPNFPAAPHGWPTR